MPDSGKLVSQCAEASLQKQRLRDHHKIIQPVVNTDLRQLEGDFNHNEQQLHRERFKRKEFKAWLRSREPRQASSPLN